MSARRSSRRSSRSSKRDKVVKGAKTQTRPSASYYYKTLKKPVGFQISYRPRKSGKFILHELAVRKNGSPYWKALDKLPKKKGGMGCGINKKRVKGGSCSSCGSTFGGGFMTGGSIEGGCSECSI